MHETCEKGNRIFVKINKLIFTPWMQNLVVLTVLCLTGFFLFLLVDYKNSYEKRPLVFVISIDAFRHDFIDRPESQVLRDIGKIIK